MTIDDIKKLIAEDEHRTLELKKSTGELKEGMCTGVRRMIDLCREQGLPEPEYQSDGYTVKIVFWKKDKKDVPNVPDNVPDVPNNSDNLSMVDLTDRQRKICEMIHANSLVTTLEMSVALSVAQKTIKRDLTDLQAKGAVARIGSAKTGHWEVLIDNFE